MTAKTNIDEVFERRMVLPDFAARDRLAALVGLDGQKARLTKMLSLLINPNGVKAFIRGVDRFGNGKLPAAVIMCTNRLGALDPAVKRRAADILLFGRPDEAQRRALLAGPLGELGFSAPQIEQVVTASGPKAQD